MVFSRWRWTIESQKLGGAFCFAGAGLGAISLLGWLIGQEEILTLFPGDPIMVPNTSLSLMLLGVAGGLRREQPAKALSAFLTAVAAACVLMIAVGTLAEYALNLETGLDQFIIRAHGGPFPGRPSPFTALALSFLAAALLVFDAPQVARQRPSEWCAMGAGVIACTALLGQLLGAGPLFAFGGNLVTGMAVPTGVGILMIASGLLLERPDTGLMRLVTSAGPGGVLLRRLAPAAVVAPVAFATISAHLMRVAHPSQVDFVLAALTVSSILASLFFLAITASRLARAHKAIARLQAEARDLIDLASDAILVADAQGHYLDVNLAGQRMFGYPREELLAKTVMDMIPAEDLQRLEDQRQALLAGAVRINEWKILCKDGTPLPAEVSTRMLPDGRWLAFIRDISNRKRSQTQQQFLLDLGAALPATLDFNEALSKVVDLCIRDLADICIVDLFENSKGLVRARLACRDPAQRTLCHSLGHPRLEDAHAAEIRGRTGPVLFDSFATDAVASWGVSQEQAEAAGFRSALEIPLLARGHEMGRILLITTACRRFEARDLPFATAFGQLAALSIDNKRLYREAMEAARARDEIIGYVAHDLRNPLHAIALNAATLSMDKPAVKEIGREIAAATRRMNRLIQDLLDVTRIDAGQLALKLARIPVSELMEDVLESQRPLAASANIQLRVAVPGFLPDLLADRDRMLQVFENLVGNAIKFTKAGGTITLGAEAGPKEVVLSVADTGAGIAEEDMPHLFDRFWQASKGKGHGAGLGLAIVKGIVEAHEGRLSVASTPAMGSTFRFSIPTAPTGARRVLESAGAPANS